MNASAILVLVVDDFAEWRQFVSTALTEIPNVAVEEASNGSEALTKLQQMRPDLVVLDIGLPDRNGIEVAREIGKLSPESKIIFLTENRDGDLINQALCVGASHYLIKSNAGSELVAEVKAALDGRIS